jgi:hypothetical protein
MTHLYAVKLRKTRADVGGHSRVIDAGHHTTLTLNEAIKIVKREGICLVENIRHDDKTPKNTRQLNRDELLEFWKACERTK